MYKTGLVIGRFQPLHKGHAYLIKKALTYADKIIVGIGSPKKKDADNIFPLSVRKKMIEEFIKKEKLSEKVIRVIIIDDNPSDAMWLKETLKKAGKIDIVVGHNEWVNSIFQDAGFTAVSVPYYKRYILEGKKIRKLIKEGRKWKDRVPLYIGELIN